jgi:hypothetical protein
MEPHMRPDHVPDYARPEQASPFAPASLAQQRFGSLSALVATAGIGVFSGLRFVNHGEASLRLYIVGATFLAGAAVGGAGLVLDRRKALPLICVLVNGFLFAAVLFVFSGAAQSP